MGQAVAGLFEALLPVGSVIHSMLTESQFNSESVTGRWVLADGRSVAGSRYAALIAANVPDMRGTFLRGKNNGLARNPDGDLTLGTYSVDKYLSHFHTFTGWFGSGGSNSIVSPNLQAVNATNIRTQDTDTKGGNETAPKSITVNIFIRIN